MCENNMLISIIIPVYNASHYINRCIDSILRQAVCEDDYEIICIDDNSNDNSREIIELEIRGLTLQKGNTFGLLTLMII